MKNHTKYFNLENAFVHILFAVIVDAKDILITMLDANLTIKLKHQKKSNLLSLILWAKYLLYSMKM